MTADSQDFWYIREERDQFWLCNTGSTPCGTHTAENAMKLKALCFKQYGVVPVRVYFDEVPFDTTNRVHLALARLEGRHSNANVVAVGSTHYLIRRSRFGVEVPVKYKEDFVGINSVHARNDMEEVIR